MIPARRLLALAGLAVALLLAVLWASGALAGLELWAAARQREAQTLIAAALRRLRAGEPGATLGLMGVCFGYGLVHAVGPGHGKLLIGGYGLGTTVGLARLSALSLLASLAQAGVAVAVVWTGIAVLDLSREALTELGEDAMADLGAALIGLVGAWLAWRGLAQLRGSDRQHHHHADGCGCGHAHAPSPAQIAGVRSWRDAALLVIGIAARPCTGAIFLLILTWRMQIFPAGVAGTMAMGLGTASVSVLVAVLSVWARRGSLALLPVRGRLAAAWLPGAMQLAAGAVVTAVAAAMLW